MADQWNDQGKDEVINRDSDEVRGHADELDDFDEFTEDQDEEDLDDEEDSTF